MEKQTNQALVNPHDQFFRTAMSDKRVAREFLMVYLPCDLSQCIDFNCLDLQPRSYINDVRKESTVDVLFKTRIAGREAYLYLLLEHQSHPDELMPFRVLKYLCNAIDQHIKVQKTKILPLVYPVVVYHGERPYPFSTNINDLVDAPKHLVEQYFLKPFQLIDLGQIEDESLKQHAWSGVMGFALKHIFARDVLPHLKNIAGILHSLDQSGGQDYIAIVLQYFLERGELSDHDAFFRLIDTSISHEVGGKFMSLAEKLREEGREQGLVQGLEQGLVQGELRYKVKIAQKMLREGSDPVFVAKFTELALSEIKELQNVAID